MYAIVSIVVALLLCGPARAQEQAPIGRVQVEDAQIAGALEVSSGEAVLHGSATVTARNRTAELRLERGGDVQVCATSVLHVTTGPKPAEAPAPLLLGLDRGAMQVHTAVSGKDVLMTPDLRITVGQAGLLNLGIRVVTNGDTCMENSGTGAPVLDISEQLGGASYQLRPGQHVLFERGSVREVVDNESSPCGCPPEIPKQELAETGGGGMVAGGASPREAPAKEHPFPAAESQGLTAGGSMPSQAPAGQVHAQVGATLAYGEAGMDEGGGTTSSSASPAGGAAAARPDAAGTGTATGSSAAPDRAGVAPAGMPSVPQRQAAGSPPVAAKTEEKGGFFHRFLRLFRRLGAR